MSDKFDVVDEEDDGQTVALDENESSVEVEDEGGAGGDEDFEAEAFDKSRGAGYRAENSVYSVMVVLTTIAYIAALVIILVEMQDYTLPDQFLWGAAK